MVIECIDIYAPLIHRKIRIMKKGPISKGPFQTKKNKFSTDRLKFAFKNRIFKKWNSLDKATVLSTIKTNYKRNYDLTLYSNFPAHEISSSFTHKGGF